MMMRIDLNYGPQATLEGNRSGATNSAPALSTNAASRNFGQNLGEVIGESLEEDQAQLSGAHTQVLALSAQAAQLPEVRQQRVQALRQAVESGQYHASPQQVAGAVFAQLVSAQAA
jgi:flagellar biosynthesis anti-sigma factor FlgM